eukprot:TRINITY_DN105129_c0_g1_i1.p1 TRINITY_DN105129_c0_g1~~TRINITY_DN105129_c0_g1_i1.p1  ORF type:complete len:468 (-),score=93.77 TRINITY_DN105129_c0_g1_i1:112-1515(-)
MVRSRVINDVDVSAAAADQVEQEVARMEERLAMMREVKQSIWQDAPNWRSPQTDAEEMTESFDFERWQRDRQEQFSAETETLDAQANARLEALERRAAAMARQQEQLEEERLIEEADDEARIHAGCTHKEWSARKAKAAYLAKQASKKRPGEWYGIDAFLQDIGLGRYGYGALLRERALDTPEALAAVAPSVLKKLGFDQKHEQRIKMGIAEIRTFKVSSGTPQPSNLIVTGAEKTLQWDSMGIFTKQEVCLTENQDGRPIYKNEHGKYLFFWRNDLQWQIGDAYDNSDCVAFSSCTSTCPTEASHWFLWDGSDWSDAARVTINQAQAPLVALADHRPNWAPAESRPWRQQSAAGDRRNLPRENARHREASSRPSSEQRREASRPQSEQRRETSRPSSQQRRDAQRPRASGESSEQWRDIGVAARRSEAMPPAVAPKPRPRPPPARTRPSAAPDLANNLRALSIGRR